MNNRPSDHILIVDDDREIRELLTTYLVKNGLRVVAVPTEGPIEVLREGAIDRATLEGALS